MGISAGMRKRREDLGTRWILVAIENDISRAILLKGQVNLKEHQIMRPKLTLEMAIFHF